MSTPLVPPPPPTPTTERPIFRLAPGLLRIPHLPLGNFPTPLIPLPRLAHTLGLPSILAKRDDIAGTPVGGNKVRKLEFSLAAARRAGATALSAYGSLGSNWTVAALAHAATAGLPVDLVLFQRPLTPSGQANLEYCRRHARTVLEVPSVALVPLALARLPRTNYLLPPGGTSPTTILAYVDAALELAEQIRRGRLAEPDQVWLPLGTCGTAAGLWIGLRWAGLRTTVRAVRVNDRILANRPAAGILVRRTLDLLHAHDARGLPRPGPLLDASFTIVQGFIGKGYGYATPEGDAADRWAARNEDLRLDPIYSGKTLAALASRRGAGRHVLFWLTHNSHPLPPPPDYEAPSASPPSGCGGATLGFWDRSTRRNP